MSALPDAVVQTPACGACYDDTTWDEGWVCEDCQLYFEEGSLTASFLDPEAEPCGRPCDNYWHGDNKVRLGLGFDCSPCKLPAGHTSLHWNGCDVRRVG
jgi:hypothetical protein